MARLFHRHYAPLFGNPDALQGPLKGLTLREWEASVVLCSLPLALEKALLTWLIAPTDPRWPRPDEFSRHLLPFTESDLRQPVKPLPKLLFAELKAIRHTLDMSLEALHGITRDVLLVALGTRLRQIVWALGEDRALKEIETLLRLTRQPPPRPAVDLSTRWGGRWAGFFAGAAAGE